MRLSSTYMYGYQVRGMRMRKGERERGHRERRMMPGEEGWREEKGEGRREEEKGRKESATTVVTKCEKK